MGEEVIEVREKPDSVTLKKNAKGEYSHDIKVYFDSERNTKDEVLTKIEELDKSLNDKYGGKKNDE